VGNKENDDTGADTQGETEDIDEAIDNVVANISPGGGKVVLYHSRRLFW
jgi:hypothetical protein